MAGGKSGGFWQLERANRRRTLLLVAALILLLAAFGLALDFFFHTLRFSDGRISGIPLFTAAAVILAVAKSLRAYFSGADLVLGAMGAHPIYDDDPKNQVVINVVREMALAARIPTPRIDVIDDPSPNAFAVGRDPDHSVICVTQGLLDQMDREELQGVIGHEMAHIRNCDTRLTTLVTAIFRGFPVFGSRIISTLASREREYLADASTVEFTRNPTALIRALEHLAKTESPLGCASQSTAQLFIVDPFESASGGGSRSYKGFINEITRLRMQSGKTGEQRDAEARNFAAHEYPRNFVVEKVSNHPPLRERIARLQALAGITPVAIPGGAEASGVSDDQLQAKFSESAMFVRNLASTDPEVLAKTMQAAMLGSPLGRRFLQGISGATQTHRDSTARDPLEQKLYEANLASTGDLERSRSLAQKPYESDAAASDFDPSRYSFSGQLLETLLASTRASRTNDGEDPSLPTGSTADPASGKDSATTEALEVQALAKFLSPVTASMRLNEAASHPTAETAIRPASAKPPTGSRGIFLFWTVIAISAGAIVASLAIK
jgi:heat shock protein HtpX